MIKTSVFTTLTTQKLIESQIFIAVLAIIAFLIFLKLIHILLKCFSKNLIKTISDLERTKEINTITHVLKSTIDIVLTITFLMFLLTSLGIDIRPILAAAGVLGVAVGFGAKKFIEDIITGLIIILEGQIRVGDVVEIGTKSGVVEKVDLKMVVLRDIKGNVHYIRNGMIDIVTNMTRDFSYYVMDLGVSYKENIDTVISLIEDTFSNQLLQDDELKEKILDNIEILGVDALADSSVIIKLRIKTQPMAQWQIGRRFNKLIKEKFDENNIEIPFNQLSLHLTSDK